MAIAVANKETMRTELSSKVRDSCQMCNWARTVTLTDYQEYAMMFNEDVSTHHNNDNDKSHHSADGNHRLGYVVHHHQDGS